MILLVGGEKGGTGKTTIAVNLAAMRALAGHDVLLIDADRQGTASLWAALRDEAGQQPRVTTVQKTGSNLHHEVQALAGKFADVVIDAGGRDSVELRAAMLVADVMLAPVKPSQFDAWTLATVEKLAADCRLVNPQLQVMALVNQASPNPAITEADDAREFVQELAGIALAQTVLRDRISYRKAAREGRAVVEHKPADAKAVAEISALYAEVWTA
jgi:chromosome partitioning protein